MSVLYKVGNYDSVEEQMRTLLGLASLAGIREAYMDALKEMAYHLQNDPLEWGDPVYQKPFLDGLVCHALVGPIVVRYSVHEAVNAVLIIEIIPLFDWPIHT